MRAEHALAKRVLGHWIHRQLHLAWNSWVEYCEWRNRSALIVNRVLKRMQNRVLWAGYNQWRTEFGWQAGRMHQLLNRVVGRLLHRQLALGWHSWRALFVSARNIKFMLSRTTRRMINLQEYKGWHTWHEAYLSHLVHKRIIQVANKALKHLINRELSKAFVGLGQHAKARRIRALHGLQKASDRFKGHASGRHWVGRHYSRAYNAWRAHYLSWAASKAKVQFTMAKLNNRDLNRAFNQWLYQHDLYSYHRRILRYTAGRLLHQELGRGLSSLRLNARRERMAQEYEAAARQEHLITSLSTAHAVARWSNRLLTHSWLVWRNIANKQRRAQRAMMWCTHHMTQRQLSRAYNQWGAVVLSGRNKRKAKQLLASVSGHFQYREQAKALNSWSAWYHHLQRVKAVLKYTSGSWRNMQQNRAFNQWYAEYAEVRELQRITRWITGHWMRRELAIGFDQWHNDCLAWRTLHPLRQQRKELRGKVQYYVTEEGKLKQRHAELEEEVAKEQAEHAATSEKLGNHITGLERNLSETERLNQLAELHKAELKERVLELEDRLAQVRAQWDESEAELSRQIEALVTERSASHRAHCELEHLDDQCASLEDQLAAKQAQLDALQAKHEAEGREFGKQIARLTQELEDHKAMIERHGLGRNADAQRFREEISLLADKLQAAEQEMYRVNKEKQAAMVEWQRERHAANQELTAAEASAKSAADAKERAERTAEMLERDLAEERDANQELVTRLNAYAREMAERDREHSLRRAAELREAESNVHKALMDSEESALRCETVESGLRAELAAQKEATRAAQEERDEAKAAAKDEQAKMQGALRHMEQRLSQASHDAADAADRFSRERDNDRRLLMELEAQMLSTIRERERETEGANQRVERVRSELASVEARLEEERNRVRAEEAKRQEAEREAQHMQEELMSPRRLDPVRAAEERLALCMNERDEIRFQMDDELRRMENKVREQQAKYEHAVAEARQAEDDHAAKVDALRAELRSCEERAAKAEIRVDQAEQAKHSAVLEARGNELRRGEIGAVLEAQRSEMETLRSRLSQLEGARHEEALKAEQRLRELQGEMRTVENAAKEEIRRLDQELSNAQQAQKAAEQLVAQDASVRQQELNLRVQSIERQREEERRQFQGEIARLNEEIRASETHIERLNRELASAGDRSARQHEGDRREVSEMMSRIQALQNEKEMIEVDAHRKVNELAETLSMAKAEIRRLDMELRSPKPMIYV